MSDKKKKAFSEIYNKYVNGIFRFVFLKVDSRQTAEDLTSETFLKGWRAFKIQNPISKIKNPRAFLYKIARNLVIDYYRQKAHFRIVSIENAKFVRDPKNLEEEMNLDLDMLRIRTALSKLQDTHQEIIILRYLDNLSIFEIAEILDKSEGAVRVGLHRALKALRAVMEMEQ